MALISFFRIALMTLEITACAASFAAMPVLKKNYWKWMPFYLLAIVVGELLGYYLAYTPVLNAYNPMLFNYLLCPLQVIFLNWLLSKNIADYDKVKSSWVLYGILLYILCWLADCFLIPDTSLWVSTFSFSVGMLLILFSIIVFFYCYINSNDIVFFKTDRIFWICLGLFLYYVAALPFEGLRNTLLKQPQLFMICWYIDMGLACMMYLLFTISFIWAKRR